MRCLIRGTILQITTNKMQQSHINNSNQKKMSDIIKVKGTKVKETKVKEGILVVSNRNS